MSGIYFFERLSEKEAQNLNPLVLAYVGDAVQTLFVREKLARENKGKVGALHKTASRIVNASNQAAQAESVFEQLTEEEKSIYLRGRNGKSHHKAKNQSGSDYRKATGWEALLGYLYLIGREERLLQLLDCRL